MRGPSPAFASARVGVLRGRRREHREVVEASTRLDALLHSSNAGQLRVRARIMATAIMGAVSARKMRGPRPRGVKLVS